MKSGIASALLILSLCLAGHAGSKQASAAPLSKQEIISMLKQVGQRQLSQADIAVEIEQRGIGFGVDEKVVNELRQAGARSFLIDAIKRMANSGGRPPVDNSGAVVADPKPMSAEAV